MEEKDFSNKETEGMEFFLIESNPNSLMLPLVFLSNNRIFHWGRKMWVQIQTISLAGKSYSNYLWIYLFTFQNKTSSK